MKKSPWCIIALVLSLALCLTFFIVALTVRVPPHRLKSSNPYGFFEYGVKESVPDYVGGDAYNYIIEASLRGGEISGAMVTKTICFAVSGVFLLATFNYLPTSILVAKQKLQQKRKAENLLNPPTEI